jgi:hypothetical protein
MRVFLLLSICFLVGCASSTGNRQPLSFHGIVQTKEGTPLSNVRVTLYEDAFSWNPSNWYLRPDRKIDQTRTNQRGLFTLSTSEEIPRRKLKIVAERIVHLLPDEDPNNPRTPEPVKRPDPEKLNRIVVPDGFVPEP